MYWCRRFVRRSTRQTQKDPPARVIAVGVSRARGGGDDDAWESLCGVFAKLHSAKEDWSGNLRERNQMARYGFHGKDGGFAELVVALRR